MKYKLNIKREIKISAVVLVVIAIVVFTERRMGNVAITGVTIKLENINENHFLDENDIASLMQLKVDNIKGATMSRVNMKGIEKKIKKEPFVKNAELYSDLKGNLVVKAELRRPIARMVRNDGPDGYIAEDGTIMPVSDKFTSRVILLSGSYINTLLHQNNMNETEDGKHLMEMIDHLRADDFWNAQIVQLDIDSKCRITLMPQVGDEHIEFGKPENVEGKLEKLMIFYKEILPRMGWNKYSRVSLEYEGQIIAE